MKPFLAIFIISIVSAVCGPVHAHDITLDDNGCHRDGKYGLYHCHEGKYAGESFVSLDDYPGMSNHSPKLAKHLAQATWVRRNSAGVCVTPDSVMYTRHKKFRVYKSVSECVRYGGHLDGTVILSRKKIAH